MNVGKMYKEVLLNSHPSVLCQLDIRRLTFSPLFVELAAQSVIFLAYPS
jgi:hypothetical protein